MAYTPGPWHRNIKPASKYPTIFAGRNTHICHLSTGEKTDAELEANISLITASPDLLAALEALTDHSITYFDLGECGGKELDIRRMAKEAIKKAKGL
jgi:hypothetical protein